MKVYLTNRSKNLSATAIYDIENKRFIVLKGSAVSESIAGGSFRSAKSIAKMREGTVENNKLIKDVEFKSASTAANFVTGRSTNGLLAWKDKDGTKLKDLLDSIR